MMNLIEQLKEHEGFRDDYYQCTANKQTIGYGRNVDDNPFSSEELVMLRRDSFVDDPMSEDEAEQLLLNDVNKVIAQIKGRLAWSNLSPVRQAVCVNMAFNIGVNGFFKFKKAIKALNNGFYGIAAVEMMDSRWAEQVPLRANALAFQMQTGNWA